MEYQFNFDALNRPVARCSMDHEAFGDWLTHDLGAHPQQIADILSQLDRLLNKQTNQWQKRWADYRLKLTQEDAIISATSTYAEQGGQGDYGDSLFDDHEALLGGDESMGFDSEELSLDDQQGHAICGLEDFQTLILAWQEFVRTDH